MHLVPTPSRVRLAVLLAATLAAATASAQVTVVSNGQTLNDFPGRGVAVADFNGDGTLDAFVVNMVTWERSEARVYFGDGHGQFSDSGQQLALPAAADQPLVYDIDGNKTADILVGRTTWMNDGRGRFTAGPDILQDGDGAPVRGGQLADLNGDGAVDLLVTGMFGPTGTNGIRLYLNDRKGTFREAGQTPLPGITSAVAFGDVNGDKRPDVVVSGWRNVESDGCPNRVLLNDGTGRFTDTGQQLDEAMRHSHSLALADLDRDGDLDVLVVAQGDAPTGHIYLNDGKGRFSPGALIGASSIEKVALADFDADGDLDVFLACIGPNEVWLNDGRGHFTDSGHRLDKEWSWQLAVGDFNGDRLPDVFVVNFRTDRSLPRDRSIVRCPAEVWLFGKRASAPSR